MNSKLPLLIVTGLASEARIVHRAEQWTRLSIPKDALAKEDEHQVDPKGRPTFGVGAIAHSSEKRIRFAAPKYSTAKKTDDSTFVETAVVAKLDNVILCSGGSPDRLRHMLRRLAPAYRAVVSFGIAGGLDVVLSPGDAVLARGIITGTTRWVAHPGLTQDWVQRLIAGGQNVVVAEIVGVDIPVLTPAAKAALRAATGAAAVDMESHVAAEFAAANGIPFAALRIVCDSATHSLPPFVCDALGANGVLGWRRVLGMLMQHPLQTLSLPRLAWDTAAAFTGLHRCRALLGPDLGIPRLGQPFSDVS